MKRRERWLPVALRVGSTVLFVVVTAAACQLVLGPAEGEKGEQEESYLELVVDGGLAPQMVDVTEYEVTSLRIDVTDPSGEVIQSIIWYPEEGRRVYQVPVQVLGEYEVAVAHRSKSETGTIEAVESETFNIAAMIITQIRIVPGAVGQIIVDAEQRAADLKAREVLPGILEQTDAQQYVVTRMPKQLVRGTKIVEDDPYDEVPQAFDVDESSYLYFIDLAPGAFYEHPVKYMLVDKDGGTKVIDAKWWPRVDDVIPEPLIRTTPDLAHVVERNIVLERPQVSIVDININPGIVKLITREAFISVQGLRPSESLYPDAVTTHQNAYNFFDAYRPALSDIVGLTDYSADNVLTQIDTLANDGYDIISIFIIAHGGTNYVRLGGAAVTAADFVAAMASHPNVQFNFLCGSCHSGSFMDELQGLANVRVVETACAANESAYADYDSIDGVADHNSADTGSEWTSSWIEAAQVLTNSSPLWDIISSRSTNYSVPKTSVLLNEAGYLGTGADRGLPTPLIDYDLTHRTGYSTPQHWNSWEIVN